MAIVSQALAVNTTAVKVATGRVGASWVTVHCDTTGNHTIYIGGANITAGNGFSLHSGSTHSFWLPETEELWAIATSSETLYVLQTGGR